MTTGAISATLEANITITVIDRHSIAHSISCIIDTNFGSHLTLPPGLIAQLGLPFLHRANVVLGDGRRVRCDVFGGQIIWMNCNLTVSIESAPTTPLIGMRPLQGSDLAMRVIPGGAVAITPIP